MTNSTGKYSQSILSKLIRFFLRDEEGSFPVFLHSLRLEDQLYDFTIVRFLVSFLIVVGSLFAKYVLKIYELNHKALILLAILLFLVNTVNFAIAFPARKKKEKSKKYHLLLVVILHLSIATDFLFLTIAIWLIGGVYSPFQTFFIFHVIITSILFSPLIAFVYTAYGYLLFLALAIVSWQQWIPPIYPIGAVPSNVPPTGTYIITVAVVQGLLFFLTASLTTHLMYFLREGQRQIVRINKDLERLCDQRKGFLQIALHNLRAPISAIAMHLQNLLYGYGGELNETQQSWVQRSLTRIDELVSFLHDLENLSVMENADLLREAKEFELNSLIEKILEENQDLIASKKHTIKVDLPEKKIYILGIQRLIREAILNFLTNAIKYTPQNGKIIVRVFTHSSYVRVEVEDNGIGISQEDIPKLFKEFVRLKQQKIEGVDTTGSGLGLYIVRQVIESHGGRVFVRSQLGKGSIFGFDLPIARRK
ncbi:MAG TPA: HAMP domain-containing sensor histidine kinase [Candidatus Hydrogenedens sp.]|nr:HAMP domain-containing histidine kinase [Candidatus Hydrogenedens sp.]HOK09251.1 HAMP domain-containing sensor histidine kinase [Candidatus Hydrogenedens sp.]HOL20619.1 HAMP domain-containing sensor histidine kinase [Candidatus Hydrogenedens sp.]HPP59463.1 HAMP domain-containing sensor histidine kinase [Candidatus Hydrogenedens sp.]